MRKLLFSLLLAGAVATPALADPGDHHHDNNNGREHQQTHSERQSSSSEGRQSNAQSRFSGNAGAGQQNFVRLNGFQQNGQVNPSQAEAFRAERERMLAAQNGGGDSQDGRRDFRRNRQGFNGGVQQQVTDESLRQHDRPLPGMMRSRDRSQMVSDIPRRGTQPPMRWNNNNRRDHVSWNTNWRNDHRYDWRDWRHRHRSTFHLGFYFDPFGWGYQPFDIGWRLWPNYYSSNYWINDPYEYRLPYAPPGTRWIRYYNDALLVDMYTGEVVDAIRDFFW